MRIVDWLRPAGPTLGTKHRPEQAPLTGNEPGSLLEGQCSVHGIKWATAPLIFRENGTEMERQTEIPPAGVPTRVWVGACKQDSHLDHN